MKLLKGLLLFFLIFLFFIIIVLFQIAFSLNHTVFSGSYFSQKFDQHQMGPLISQLIITNIKADNPSRQSAENGQPTAKEKTEQASDFSSMVLKYVDQKWLEQVVSTLFKGTQAYLVGDAEKLPSLDLKPVKESFTNSLVEDMLKRPEVKENLANVKKMMALLRSEYQVDPTGDFSAAQINQIMNRPEVKRMGLDQKTLTELMKAYFRTANQNLTQDQQTRELVKITLINRWKLDQIKDQLDVNLFLKVIFKNEANPVSGARQIIAAGKSILFRTLLLLLLILVLTIIVVGFKPKSYLRWIAGGLIGGGIGGGFIGFLGLYLPFFSVLPAKIMASPSLQSQLGGDFAPKLQTWLESFIQGAFIFFFVQGVILILLGIGLIVVSCKFIGKQKSDQLNTGLAEQAGSQFESYLKNNKVIVMLSRIGITMILLLAIPFTVIWAVDDFKAEIYQFNTVIQSTNIGDNVDVLAALGEATGMDLINGANNK